MIDRDAIITKVKSFFNIVSEHAEETTHETGAVQGETAKAKRNQNRLFIAIIVILVLGVALFIHEATSTGDTHPKPHKKMVADGVLSHDFSSKLEQSSLDLQQAELEALKKQNALLKEQVGQLSNKVDTGHKKVLDEFNSILQQKIKSASPTDKQDAPTAAVTDKSHTLSNTPFNRSLGQADNRAAPYNAEGPHRFANAQFTMQPPMEQISLGEIQYPDEAPARHQTSQTQQHASQLTKTLDTYVPAGTFAKAVLLQGADANASVNGQSNTVPILIRLLDNGLAPNGKHSHLRGCIVLASIYGDISSERGEARLTQISCTTHDGHVLETPVKGYLSFAGKEGIKGTPVMRNGAMLKWGFLSGFIGGLGKGASDASQTTTLAGTTGVTTVNPGKFLQLGAGNGAEAAGSQLSNYYIKRADQYHPIIEIGSGTVATVVFQQGFSLTDNSEANARTHSASADDTAENQTDNTNTPAGGTTQDWLSAAKKNTVPTDAQREAVSRAFAQQAKALQQLHQNNGNDNFINYPADE